MCNALYYIKPEKQKNLNIVVYSAKKSPQYIIAEILCDGYL